AVPNVVPLAEFSAIVLLERIIPLMIVIGSPPDDTSVASIPPLLSASQESPIVLCVTAIPPAETIVIARPIRAPRTALAAVRPPPAAYRPGVPDPARPSAVRAAGRRPALSVRGSDR